jgi:hypothetical protein
MNYFICLLAFLLALSLQAQEVRTNEDGDKIIVYPDGSWKYFSPGSFDEPFVSADGYGELPVGAREREALLEERERIAAIRRAEKFSAEARRYMLALEATKQERKQIQEDLSELKKLEGVIDSKEIRDLESKLLKALQEEKQAAERYREARELSLIAERMIDIKRKKRDKAMRKAAPRFDAFIFRGVEAQTQELTPTTRPKRIPVAYDPSKDLMLNPPPGPCRIAYSGTDDFTGKTRKDVASQLLFTYTRDELRTYLNGRDYISCRGYMTSMSGGLVFLSLEFSIVSKTAQQTFGGIPKGGVVSFLMMNGETVRLSNVLSDPGSYNPNTETFSFRSQFTLSAGQEKMLAEGEVDKIRVVWKAGFEDYEIYYLDFFKDQLDCLKKG